MWSDGEDVSNAKNILFKWNFYLSLVGKKDGDHRSVINLKSIIDVFPIFISKRDVFTVNAINIGQALDVQTGIEESILQCFT